MTTPLTREQVEARALVIKSAMAYAGQRTDVDTWLDTDAALRVQLDSSIQIQETLAKNVNDGLLENQQLKAKRDHHKWKQEQNEQEVDRLLAKVEEASHAVQVHSDILGETIHKHEKEVANLQQQLAAVEANNEHLVRQLGEVRVQLSNAQAEVNTLATQLAAVGKERDECKLLAIKLDRGLREKIDDCITMAQRALRES